MADYDNDIEDMDDVSADEEVNKREKKRKRMVLDDEH